MLVTGSRGFVGGGLGRLAAASGHAVLGVGRTAMPAPAWPGEYVQTDVATADLAPVLRRFAPDVVAHAAGSASVGGSLAAPLDDFRAQLPPWANLLDGVRRSGGSPIVLFLSSAAVYGNPSALPVPESAPRAPISPYGYHKACCEDLGREYAACFGLGIVVARLFSVFGPAQRRLLAWEIYQQLVGPEDAVWLEGTGAETRDYLHIDDATAALLAILEGCSGLRGACLVVNVASGEETRVLDLAGHLKDLLASGKPVRCRGSAKPGDPARWWADISLLRSLARGWRPRPLRERMAECIAAWQSEAGAAGAVPTFR